MTDLALKLKNVREAIYNLQKEESEIQNQILQNSLKESEVVNAVAKEMNITRQRLHIYS